MSGRRGGPDDRGRAGERRRLGDRARTCQTRGANSSAGQSHASVCTSCGSASVTAPVPAGSVSTRMAASRADGSCSGRQTRSKNTDTGRNASLTDTSSGRGVLQFLQDGRGDPGGEHIAGQQQDRQPVDGGEGGAGDHVRGARADRRGARPGRQPVAHPRERRRRCAPSPARSWPGSSAARRAGPVRPRAAPGRSRRGCRGRRCRSSRRRTAARPVALAALRGQEPHHSLAHGEPDRPGHRSPPGDVSRGSSPWSGQVP